MILFGLLGTDEAAPPAKRVAESIPRLLDGKYFAITKRDKFSIHATCTTCGKIRKGDIRSTGNFLDHYKNSHSHLVKEITAYRQKNTVNMAVIKKQQKTLTTIIKPFKSDEVILHKFQLLDSKYS